METENSKRELKCKGGSVRETVIDRGFGYIDFKEPDRDYAPDLSKISSLIKEQKKIWEHNLANSFFVKDLAKELKFDNSHLRRFCIKHKIPVFKIIDPRSKQSSLALTKENAEEVIRLRFDAEVTG